MQHMSDKEFDKLFQQKFESLEVDPSAAVWKGIENELGNKKRGQRKHYFLWSAAASIVMIVTAAVWFAPQKEKVWLQKDKDTIAKAEKSKTFAPSADKPAEIRKPKIVTKEPVLLANNPKPTRRLADKESEVEKATLQSPASRLEVSQQIIEEIPNAEAIGTEKVIAFSTVKMEDELPGTALVLAADAEGAPAELGRKGREVRSIGDLVNFVVGKVDKRQDKLIQFRDNDEGSFITGVNLGIVKIKTRNY